MAERERERESMNEEIAQREEEGDALYSQSQIQLMPLSWVDQVMTWGLLD